jgi:hypothetical protein
VAGLSRKHFKTDEQPVSSPSLAVLPLLLWLPEYVIMSSHEGHGVKLLFAIVAEFAVTA